jgi:hypothetical protein
MDDADAILLVGLRDALGGASVLPDGVSSAKEVDADLLVAVCSACLRAIAPEQPPPPERLPPDMAGRFRVGTDLAGRIKQLGYRGDLGFHQLLYPNETEVRRVLVFLLDTLPKAAPTVADASRSGAETAAQRVQAALKAWVRADVGSTREAPLPFWTCPLDPSRTDAPVTAQATPATRLAPSLLEFVAVSASAGEGAQSSDLLLRLARGAAADQDTARKAALRDSIRAALNSGGASEGAGGGARRGAVTAPAATGGAASEHVPSKSIDVAEQQATPGSALERMEADLTRFQADLQTALADIAAAEQRCVEHDAAVSASRRDAASASEATPALEQEYLLRKQAATMLAVRPRCASRRTARLCMH